MSSEVGIIGAGLAGLSLALALHQQSIPCTIYETRKAPVDIGGTIILSPNALSVLDALGVYKRLQPYGCECDHLYFRTQDDELVDSYKIGGKEEYGYNGLRVYRHHIITELSAALQERNVPMQFDKKFSRILSETDSEVTWEFEDGTIGRAGALVGADGIHSRVRRYLYPNIEPSFTKVVAVTAAVPASQVRVPAQYRLPVTITGRKHGGYVLAFQNPDRSEIVIGKQTRFEELDRAGWTSLLVNKEWCTEFLRRGAKDFPGIVQRCVETIPTDKINVWPFYVVPRLERWTSVKGSVTILGDAAHAIPPSSGQGANQVFEDTYSYALIRAQQKGSLREALFNWKNGRQERIDKLHEFAEEMNRRRLPDSPTTNELAKDSPVCSLDMDWLFRVDLKEMVREWINL